MARADGMTLNGSDLTSPTRDSMASPPGSKTSVPGEPSDRRAREMCSQRKLLKQLQQVTKDQASQIETLQRRIKGLEQSTMEHMPAVYLERLQAQQSMLEERQRELEQARKELQDNRQEVEHVRAMMGGLEDDASERERVFSQAYNVEKERLRKDWTRQTDMLTRTEHDKQMLQGAYGDLKERAERLEQDVRKLDAMVEQSRHSAEVARREADIAKHERHQLFEELEREQQERQDVETRHRLEVEKVERRAEAVTQEKKAERADLTAKLSESEMRITVLQNQISHLEDELLRRQQGGGGESSHQTNLPGSAVLQQLRKAEEQINRLMEYTAQLEQQEKLYYHKVSELEAKLAAAGTEVQRVGQRRKESESEKNEMEKTLRGLTREVAVLKEDLSKSRERTAALEQESLAARVRSEQDSASLEDRDNVAKLRIRTLEQHLQEREMELEANARRLCEREAAAKELHHKLTQLQTSNAGKVSELLMAMAANEEAYHADRQRLSEEVLAASRRAEDAEDEAKAVEDMRRTEVDKLSSALETAKKDTREVHLELTRARVKLEGREREVQRLHSAMEDMRGAQAALQSDGKETAIAVMKDRLQALTTEIENVRKERDAVAEEARAMEDRLRKEIFSLKAALDAATARPKSSVLEVGSAGASQDSLACDTLYPWLEEPSAPSTSARVDGHTSRRVDAPSVGRDRDVNMDAHMEDVAGRMEFMAVVKAAEQRYDVPSKALLAAARPSTDGLKAFDTGWLRTNGHPHTLHPDDTNHSFSGLSPVRRHDGTDGSGGDAFRMRDVEEVDRYGRERNQSTTGSRGGNRRRPRALTTTTLPRLDDDSGDTDTTVRRGRAISDGPRSCDLSRSGDSAVYKGGDYGSDAPGDHSASYDGGYLSDHGGVHDHDINTSSARFDGSMYQPGAYHSSDGPWPTLRSIDSDTSFLRQPTFTTRAPPIEPPEPPNNHHQEVVLYHQRATATNVVIAGEKSVTRLSSADKGKRRSSGVSNGTTNKVSNQERHKQDKSAKPVKPLPHIQRPRPRVHSDGKPGVQSKALVAAARNAPVQVPSAIELKNSSRGGVKGSFGRKPAVAAHASRGAVRSKITYLPEVQNS